MLDHVIYIIYKALTVWSPIRILIPIVLEISNCMSSHDLTWVLVVKKHHIVCHCQESETS